MASKESSSNAKESVVQEILPSFLVPPPSSTCSSFHGCVQNKTSTGELGSDSTEYSELEETLEDHQVQLSWVNGPHRDRIHNLGTVSTLTNWANKFGGRSGCIFGGKKRNIWTGIKRAKMKLILFLISHIFTYRIKMYGITALWLTATMF